MTKNPILDKLHATRERLLAESGGTVSGLLDRLRADQAASKRPIYKPANHDRDRDPDYSEAPPTPPGVRVRSGRFSSSQ